MIRQGVLKVRTVPREKKGTHFQLFLIKDNKDILPPKKLVESHNLKEEKDGQGCFRVVPWYKVFDPKEHLKGYKIMDYLEIIEEPKK